MSRGKLIAAISIVAMMLVGSAFYHDLNLGSDVRIDNAPDIIVKRIEFKREISGRRWQVAADSAEHADGVIKAEKITVNIAPAQDSFGASLFSVSGDLTVDSSAMILYDTKGIIEHDELKADIFAQIAEYDQISDVWSFPSSLSVSSDRGSIWGQVASIDASGKFTFGRGASAEWHFQ